MSLTKLLTTGFLSVMVLISALCMGQQKGKGKPPLLKTRSDSIAYVIGLNIGGNLKENLKRDSLLFSPEIMLKGVHDGLKGYDTLWLSSAEKKRVMDIFQHEMMKKMEKKHADEVKATREAGKKWLEENRQKPDVFETPSGLQYKIIRQGYGITPGLGDSVTLHYEGRFINGEIFDSTFEMDKPLTFPLSLVIPGFREGVMLMREGAIYELYISPDLGYGDEGAQGIPGGATLIFRVELIKVNQ